MFFHDSHRQNHQPVARASQSLNFRERNFRKVPHRFTLQVRGAQRSFSASFPIARALFAFNCPLNCCPLMFSSKARLAPLLEAAKEAAPMGRRFTE
jgi:hypothetical protein